MNYDIYLFDGISLKLYTSSLFNVYTPFIKSYEHSESHFYSIKKYVQMIIT